MRVRVSARVPRRLPALLVSQEPLSLHEGAIFDERASCEMCAVGDNGTDETNAQL
jgi:hypothetical protein